MSLHQAHEATIRGIHELIAGCGPEDHAERERLLWNLVGIHAGALTPVSENEKRGMERVLAILERKIAEGGAGGGDEHGAFYRARWTAFRECAFMLRAALAGVGANSPPPSSLPAGVPVSAAASPALTPHRAPPPRPGSKPEDGGT